MYCNYCNKSFDNIDAKFCPICGSSLDIHEAFNVKSAISSTTSDVKSAVNKAQRFIDYFGKARRFLLFILAGLTILFFSIGFPTAIASQSNLSINKEDIASVNAKIIKVEDGRTYNSKLETYEYKNTIYTEYEYEGKSYKYDFDNSTSVNTYKSGDTYVLYVLKAHPEEASEYSPESLIFIGKMAFYIGIACIIAGSIVFVIALVVLISGLVKAYSLMNKEKEDERVA